MADIAQEAGLVADEPALSGINKLFNYLWTVAWENAPGTIAGDAEALHDMRVAIRRLRSAMQNFEGSKDAPLLGARLRREFRGYRRTLGRVGDALGSVRDLDVLDDYLQGYSRKQLKREIGASPGLATFERFLQNERADAFGPMVRRLNKSRSDGGLRDEFSRFVRELPDAQSHLEEEPASTIQTVARKILPLRIEEVLAHANCLDDPDNAFHHHELRKALRRVRYTLETLAPCFKEPVKPYVEKLVELQDLLGEMQDRTVLHETAQRAFEADHKKKGNDALADDVVAFLEYGENRRRSLLAQSRRMWGEHLESGFFDRLREL